MTRRTKGAARGRRNRSRGRSALVRMAAREFAERELRRQEEAREGAIIRRHRKGLARQARALVTSQGTP